MSSIFKSENIGKDFESFSEEIFKTNQYVAKDETIKLPSFKKLHRLMYTFALIQFKTSENHKDLINKFVFLLEMQSDLLMFTTLIFQGFKNSALIQYRRIIENFYNHIYFFNHEIEFVKLNNGRNEYTPLIELKEYLNSYPNLKDEENVRDFNNHIFSDYTELNKVVHTKGVNFMSLSNNLREVKSKIKFDTTFTKINDVLYRIIYILYKFHNDLEYTNIEKRIVSDCIPKTYRGSLNN